MRTGPSGTPVPTKQKRHRDNGAFLRADDIRPLQVLSIESVGAAISRPQTLKKYLQQNDSVV